MKHSQSNVLIVICCSLSGLALAHGGVKNPAVMARMTGMTDAAEATKILGDMALEKISFDAGLAQSAKTDLITALMDVPILFAAPENDPKSEALPMIWSDTQTFQDLADTSLNAAKAINTTSIESISAGIGTLGASCSACHRVFRQDQ